MITYSIQYTDETLFNDAFDLNEPSQELFDKELNDQSLLDDIDSKKYSFEKEQQNRSSELKAATYLVVIVLLLKSSVFY